MNLLAKEKENLLAHGGEAQHTTLNHRLGGNPIDGFVLLFRSPYLLLLALFLLLPLFAAAMARGFGEF